MNDVKGIDVDVGVIMGSLTCAVLHGVIEFVFLGLEAKACKTNIIHYSIVCFNARFGWIPFSHLFASMTGGQETAQERDIDYKEISSSLLGQDF